MKARIIGGRYMKVAAADIPPQSIKNSCMNVYIPTVAVRDATEEVTTKAIGNSFHENTNIRRAVVSIPGLERGTRIFQSTDHHDASSISATSSNILSISSM